MLNLTHKFRDHERLAALKRYDVLDTPVEEAFDRLTRLTQRIFNVPIAAISLIDDRRQWFKSCQSAESMPRALARAPALCNYCIEQDEPLVVEDAATDPRFSESIFVRGAPYIRFYAGAQIRTPDDYNIGTLCVIDQKPRRISDTDVENLRDLASIVMRELELRLVASTDALTGALSRRELLVEGNRALASAQRSGACLSCAVFDLDHFKQINDQHGHAMGDQVLAACVRSCWEELQAGEFVARVGGEEFVLLLPGCNLEVAMERSERVRAAIANIVIEHSRGIIKPTASFGVADWAGAVQTLDGLLAAADQALYAAKLAGRNRCHAYLPAFLGAWKVG